MYTKRLSSVVCATFLTAFAVLSQSTVSIAQSGPDGPGFNPFPTGDNQWHLGYSVPSFSTKSTFAEVASTGMGDQDKDHPGEVNGIYKDDINKISLANPPAGCQNTGPAETNACVFQTANAIQEDDHHIRYNFRNWGGRCTIWLKVNVFAPTSDWKWADLTPWSNGQTFIVVVPVGAANPEVFGKLKGVNIFMTPSDPLSAIDKENFTLVDHPKVVPGLGTIYRITTK